MVSIKGLTFAEKGFNLLYYLEQLLGGPDVFEPYMKAYVQQFAGKSLTTQEWKSFLYDYMRENHGDQAVQKLDSVDWDGWFTTPGMVLYSLIYPAANRQ